MLLAIITSTPPPPPDIWHDPNAIGLMGLGIGIATIVVGAAVAIAIGTYQVRKQRPHREITYYPVVLNVPVTAMNIEILMNGKRIPNARFTILKVQNTGDISVREQDYFEAIAVEFPDTEILSVETYETKPTSLINPSRYTTYAEAIDNGASRPRPTRVTLPPKSTSPKPFFTVEPHTIKLPNFPLNPGEFISFKVTLKGESRIQRRGRLNQGEIVESSPDDLRSSRLHSVILDYALPILLGALIAIVPIALIGWVFTVGPLLSSVPLTILVFGLLSILPILRLPRSSVPKIRVWSIGKRQLAAMVIGTIIYSELYYGLTAQVNDSCPSTALFFSPYICTFFNPIIIPSIGGAFGNHFVLYDILYSLATTIPLFFAIEFGPWVGLVSIVAGTLFVDYITNQGLSISYWLSPWYWYLSDAIFVFIPGLALLATKGRYNTARAIAIAVGFSAVGIVTSNIVKVIGNGITN